MRSSDGSSATAAAAEKIAAGRVRIAKSAARKADVFHDDPGCPDWPATGRFVSRDAAEAWGFRPCDHCTEGQP